MGWDFAIKGIAGSLALIFAVALQTQAATYYVNALRPNDTGVATNWATAKMTIQAAVNLAVSNDTVLVTNGIYNSGTTVTPKGTVNNRVVITNNITLRSVDGPDVTIIEGSGTNFYDTASAVRCVFIKKGVLDGFTLRSGTTYGYDRAVTMEYDASGGGVNMYGAASGTTVMNCVIQIGKAVWGGGSCFGTLNNCTLSGNTASEYGGGSIYGTLNNCTLSNNTAFTVGGGSYDGTLNNCMLAGNNSANAGGGSGFCTLNNCTLTCNTADQDGGGSHSGTLSNCMLAGNNSAKTGGGSHNDTLNNCMLSGNKSNNGGGSCDGNLNNCTLIGNIAASSGGGSYYGTLNNCIVLANTASVASNNYCKSTISYTCTTPLPLGTGNIDVDPQFVDAQNLLLRTGSPCLDAGNNVYATLSTDLLGNQRIQNGTVDMGAYEGGVSATALPVFNPPSDTLFTNSLAVAVTCATSGSTIRYTLDGSDPTETSTIYTCPIILTVAKTIVSRAFKQGLFSSGTRASYRPNCYYVDASRPDDTGPATSWATAKKTIQAAVNIAVSNDTVLVTNGVYNSGTTVTPGYSVSNRVVVTNAITVLSVNGANSTIIEGSGITAYGTPSAIRCVYMRNGVLDGFTIRNGATFDITQSSIAYNHGGGGVCMIGAVAGTGVRNSVIWNCKAYSGGAAYQGTLSNSTLIQNWSYMSGGGSYAGTQTECLVSSNYAGSAGGGSYLGALTNCKLTGNTAGGAGGGSYLGALTNCKLTGNTAGSAGGGSSYGTLIRCVLSSNASASGGGSYYGTLNNCSFFQNSASSGGGAYASTLENCTLVGNNATSGGGTYGGGTINNCIVWGNTKPDGSTNNYYSGIFQYSCTTPLAAGLGNIVSDPLLVNLSDLRIREGSPCVNGGNNAYVTSSLDNLGNARIQDGTVDMGAYEGAIPVVPMPIFNPVSGTAFTNSLAVNITNSMAETAIFYTLDGSEPTTNSQVYTVALLVLKSTTVKSRAFKTGFAESLSSTASYTLQQVATPTYAPVSGATGTNSVTVTLSCATTGCTINYTLDGSEPAETNTLYSVPVTLTQNRTIKAKAFKSGMADSVTASASYTVYAAVPVFNPPSGTLTTNSITFFLSCLTEGSVIRYTTNGVEPTVTSTLYTNPVSLFVSSIIKAKALKSGMIDSATATANYTVLQTIATPTCSPISGSVGTNYLVVSLSCATTGSEIRYTLDGSEPTAASSLYSTPVTLTQNRTIKVKAFKTGMADSAITTAAYTVIQIVATPAFAPASGTTFTNSLGITITCATVDAVIRYTLDSSDPSDVSMLYSKAFKIFKETTVRARAFKSGCSDSPIIEANYYKNISLTEAVDATNMLFTTGGNAMWTGQALASAHNGLDAAQSGAIVDNQATWMETTLSGSGSISFWWKASCEDDPDADNWDYLIFTVDGSEQHRIDGITDWQPITCTLGTGSHTLRWEYRKDDSLSDGEDCAWVDQLTFTLPPSATTTTPVPLPLSWLDQYPVLLSLANGDYETAALADVDGDGHAAWQEYVAGSIPTNYESVFRTLIWMSNRVPHVTWTPDLGTVRVYTVLGRTNLTEGVWGATNAGSRYFRTSVQMP